MNEKQGCVLFYRGLCVTIALMLGIFVFGCGGAKKTDGKYVYNLYFLDRGENTLRSMEWGTDEEEISIVAEAMLGELAEAPNNVNFEAVTDGLDVKILRLTDKQLAIDVSDNYKDMEPTREILVRAALVRTLTQIDGVDFVRITCQGEELKDALGFAVGSMNSDMFVDNAGNEINSYERTTIALYFASLDRDSLYKINRMTEYNSNISTEKLIVEQLIAGPQEGTEAFATVNPDTKILNITIKDSICYVNLSQEFMLLPEGISSEVCIYSIVNSLCELPGVLKVQISVDGNTALSLADSISLDTMFERNLELVG